MAADLIEPLERLRNDLRSVRLELEVLGADDARRGRDDLVAQVDDYLAAAAAARRSRADRRRRSRAPASPRFRQQPRRQHRQPGRRASSYDPVTGVIVTRMTSLRSRAIASFLAWRGSPAVRGRCRNAPARSPRRYRPASRCSTRRTSTRCWRRTGRSRTNCSPLRTAGSSSRLRRYADAVPWSSCARPASVGPHSSIVLNCVPVDATGEVPAHLRQMLEAGGPPAQTSSCPRSRSRASASARRSLPVRAARRARSGRAGPRRTRAQDAARRLREPAGCARPSSSGGDGVAEGGGRNRARPTSPTPRRCGRSSAPGAARSCAARCRALARGRRHGRRDARARDQGSGGSATA